MTEAHKKLIYFVAALVAIALALNYFFNKRAAEMQAAADNSPVVPAPSAGFYEPYYYPSAGNFPASIPMESTVNVYVDNPALAGLNNQYIPIFGLVGMTAVSGA